VEAGQGAAAFDRLAQHLQAATLVGLDCEWAQMGPSMSQRRLCLVQLFAPAAAGGLLVWSKGMGRQPDAPCMGGGGRPPAPRARGAGPPPPPCAAVRARIPHPPAVL